MKVIKATGLVPVKALQRFKQMTAGAVFGMEPVKAMVAVSNGEVELHPIPDGVETIDYGGDPVPPKVKAPSAGKAKSAGKSVEGPVEIPAGWETIHHLQRLALAKKISGGDVATAEAADAIIREESEKRKAAPGGEQQSGAPQQT